MKLPQTFVINGQEVPNSKYTAEQFNIFFAKLGKSISDTVSHPMNDFRTHLKGHFPDNLFMQPTYRLEIIRVTQKIEKQKQRRG